MESNASSSSSAGLHALDSSIATLVELEKLGSKLQLQSAGVGDGKACEQGSKKTCKSNYISPAIGGILLEVSNNLNCWSVRLIMCVLTITFTIGMILAMKVENLKLEHKEGLVKELNRRKKKFLVEEARPIADLEKKRIYKVVEDEENVALSMVRTESVLSRIEAHKFEGHRYFLASIRK